MWVLSRVTFFVGFNTGDVGFNTGENWASPVIVGFLRPEEPVNL